MTLTQRAGVVFLCVFAYLGWLAAARFTLALNDEGIYFDGGLRILQGQMPYKDFFVLTGPGTFVLQAASMGVLGTTLTAGRIPAVWDIAVMTACLFWLVCTFTDSKLSTQITAACASFIYLAFATLGESAVVASHRWDSSAWAILAGTLIVAATRNPSARRSAATALAAGIAVGIAAWCTPTVALAVIALGACLVFYRTTLRLFPFYATGVGLVLTAGVMWLASRGAFPAMLDSMLWSTSNYSGPNRTWYAAVTGGYANLLHSTSLASATITVLLVVFLTLPATLPFFGAIWLWKRPPMSVVITLTLGVALILSTYPRWDLYHLTWVSAPFYALAAALIARASFPGATLFRRGVALIGLIAAAACSMIAIEQRLDETTQVTRTGRVHGKPADLEALSVIQARVKPSDTLFVFPIRPLFYFVTGAHNPTRYSFLQPGMFSDQDEADALSELRAHPPRFVFYTYAPPEAYLRIWPGSDPRRLRMARIEDFFQENYRETGRWADFQLLEGRSLPFAVR
jgi:hypothetical protein